MAVQGAQLRDLLTGDPHARACWELAKLPVDAVEYPRVVERAALELPLELGAQLKQMPPQPIDGAGAIGDQVFAMIRDQADLHRLLVQVGDRKLLDTVTYDRAGDRQRIDLVRLARLALALARGAHPMRRHPHDPLAGGHQRLLKAPRHVPAILDRPHAIVIQAARPANRGQMPRIIGIDLPATADLAGSLVDGRQRVRPLVRVRPDHDHMTVPSFG